MKTQRVQETQEPGIKRVTLRIPEELWTECRHLAIDRRTTFQGLMLALLAEAVENADAPARKGRKSR